MTSMTVLMAAQATGPPPNVVPSAPALSSDAMLCGILGRYHSHLRYIDYVIGKRAGVPVDVIHIKIADHKLWGQMPELVKSIANAIPSR